jgi:hypothetical protein
VVDGCSPDVGKGVTDGSVDGEWQVSETMLVGSHVDSVGCTTSRWWREGSLAFHARWRRTELGHALLHAVVVAAVPVA